MKLSIQLFTTCAQSLDIPQNQYRQQVINIARWSEKYDFTGTLIYTENRLVDPWLVANLMLQNTRSLRPLVAVQPSYMHPYSVAKMVSSLAFLYDRPVFLNMIAGGFSGDLQALGDALPHDQRYDRLTEYTAIIQQLMRQTKPVSFRGEFYSVEKLVLSPLLPSALQPGLMVSGSSPAGLAMAKNLGIAAIQYPLPAGEYAPPGENGPADFGIRIGIIARRSAYCAWKIALQRFPENRKGEIAHMVAMKTSDSHWHRQLSALAAEKDQENCYWLHPFQTHQSFCPYLVGSYAQVAETLQKYLAKGCRIFITDIPQQEEDLYHTKIVFNRAMEKFQKCKRYSNTG